MLWKLYSIIPGVGKMLYSAWYDSCAAQYGNGNDKDDSDVVLIQQCAGKAGALRPMAVAAVFFTVQAVATAVQPSINREVWPAKYTVYAVMVFISTFLHNDPLFASIFLWIARFGATFFVLLQQSTCVYMLTPKLTSCGLSIICHTKKKSNTLSLTHTTVSNVLFFVLFFLPSFVAVLHQSFSLTLRMIGMKIG
jgi:hypothetical protein